MPGSKKNRTILTIIVTAIILIISVTNQFYKKGIHGDSEGYYAWLPTVFIYHDVTFDTWADSLSQVTGYDYLPHYLHKEGDILINKYTYGSALLMAPFFMTGHIIAFITGAPADGFSMPYLVLIALSGLFYGFAGLWFVFKIARSYGASPSLSWITVMVMFLATNLYQYVVIQPAMSHVYSFAAIAAFAWVIRRDLVNPSGRNLWLAALLLGLIVAIRPFNVVVVLAVPFLTDGIPPLVNMLKRALRWNVLWKIAIAGALFPVLLIIIWYAQTGYKIFYGYKGEGFLWDSPAIVSLLFSFRKGWFVYTPIALLIFPGLVTMLTRREGYRLITFGTFAIVLIYMLASWWSWWYGDGFGMRPLVDFYPVLVIPVVLWLKHLVSERIKGSLTTITVMLIGLNLLQVWQLHAGILLPDNMNSHKYWHVFLKTNSMEYTGSVGLQSEDMFRGIHRDSLLSISNDFEEQKRGWSPWPRKMVHDSALSGSWVMVYDSTQTYSMSIGIDSARLFRHTQNLLFDGSFWYLELDTNAVLKSPLVVAIQSPEGRTTFYKAAALKEVPDAITGMWRKVSFRLTAPAPDSGSELKLYLWNKYNRRFFVDDFNTTLFKISY